MKAQFRSLNYLENRMTCFVQFLLLPAINILFLTAIVTPYRPQDFWRIATASVLLSCSLTVMNAFSDSFTKDRVLGIDRELVAINPWSLYYWGCKTLCCVLVAAAQGIVNLLLLLLVSGGQAPVLQAFCLLPAMLFAGLSLGFACSVAAWQMKNAYFWSNLIAIASNVFSGTILAYTLYPNWMKPIAAILPFGHTLGVLFGVEHGLFHDVLVSLVWLLAALVLYRFQIKAIQRKEGFLTL